MILSIPFASDHRSHPERQKMDAKYSQARADNFLVLHKLMLQRIEYEKKINNINAEISTYPAFQHMAYKNHLRTERRIILQRIRGIDDTVFYIEWCNRQLY